MTYLEKVQAALTIAEERLNNAIDAVVNNQETPWNGPKAGQIAARRDDVKALQGIINEFELFGEDQS